MLHHIAACLPTSFPADAIQVWGIELSSPVLYSPPVFRRIRMDWSKLTKLWDRLSGVWGGKGTLTLDDFKTMNDVALELNQKLREFLPIGP